MEHYSGGSFNKQWIDETFKLHEKWANLLPVNLIGLNKQQQSKEEEKAFRFLLSMMLENNYLHKDFYKVLWSKNVRTVFTVKTFAKLNIVLGIAIMNKFLKTKLNS